MSIAVLDKVGVTPLKRALVTSCCGSFILPGKLLRLHDRNVYERLFDYVIDTNVDDQIPARECFEFIVYGLFAVDDDGASTAENVAKLQTWFEHTRRKRKQHGAKLKRCERNYGGGALYLAIREGLFLVVGFGFHRVGTRKVKNRCKAIWVVIRV